MHTQPQHTQFQAWTAFAKQWGLKDASELLTDKYVDLLTRVGAYHIHENAPLKAAQLTNGQQLAMLEGGKLEIVK